MVFSLKNTKILLLVVGLARTYIIKCIVFVLQCSVIPVTYPLDTILVNWDNFKQVNFVCWLNGISV